MKHHETIKPQTSIKPVDHMIYIYFSLILEARRGHLECQENHGVETLAGARGRAKVPKETSLMGMWQAHLATPSLGWTRR